MARQDRVVLPGVFVSSWVGELSPRVSVVAWARSVPLLLGRFRCPPDDPAWREINRIGDVAHVVFPRRAVAITPVGGMTLATDANRVILYDAGQEYRRTPLDPRGDDCLFVALGEDAVEALGRTAPVVDRRGRRFLDRQRTCPASAYASLQLLGARPAPVDYPLAVDDLLLTILEDVLDDPNGRPVEARDAALAEEVRRFLGSRFDEHLCLQDVADAVGVSPFHLHRRFRATTGWTVHAYRDHLRLREGLVRVLEGATDLAAVACELGYASHSHFTARFRQAFGATPSAVRRAGHLHDRARS